MADKENEGKKDLLNSVKDTGEQSRTMEKLLKDRVVVELVENQDELDILELDGSRLRNQIDAAKKRGDDESLKQVGEFERALDETEKRKSEVSAKTVRACMVPLRYRDYRIVQTSVAEALITTEGMNFDLDTRIAMVIQERKMMTVYLSLRKAGNLSERYYGSLDDFVKVSDRTIENLYNTYVSEFEVGEKERKN